MSESERVQLTKAVFNGLKDLFVVLASVVTIWIQASTSAKLDVAAANSEAVKATLQASEAESAHKLDQITEYAKAAAKGMP